MPALLVTALVTTKFAVADAEPPSMLMLPVLESPPAPFTVRVSADVMPVLPTEMALPLVLLLVSVPPIVSVVPPEPPVLGPSNSTVPLPVMLTLPVGLTVAPFSSQKFPGNAGESGQRAVGGKLPAGDARLRAVEPQRAIDRRDLAALEFQKRVVFEEDRPGLHARRAEPRRRLRRPGSPGPWRCLRC